MVDPGVAEATQGGTGEGCPAGQVRNPNGDCLPGQLDAQGTVTGARAGPRCRPRRTSSSS
jgi:hypothetical protein